MILKLDSDNGILTYTKALKVHRIFIDDRKRKLESRYKILKMAVASWASEMVVNEAMMRDWVYNKNRTTSTCIQNVTHSAQRDVACANSATINIFRAQVRVEANSYP